LSGIGPLAGWIFNLLHPVITGTKELDGGLNTEPKPGRWRSAPLILSFATGARPAKDSLMRLLHAALTCSTEEKADAFYRATGEIIHGIS
jgi:hypothetical protein